MSQNLLLIAEDANHVKKGLRSKEIDAEDQFWSLILNLSFTQINLPLYCNLKLILVVI